MMVKGKIIHLDHNFDVWHVEYDTGAGPVNRVYLTIPKWAIVGDYVWIDTLTWVAKPCVKQPINFATLQKSSSDGLKALYEAHSIPKALVKVDDKWPHTCPNCGCKAYVGLNLVEHTNGKYTC